MSIKVGTTDFEIIACYPVMREIRPHIARDEHATQQGCQQLHLESRVQRKDAHRFYEREGMTMSSLHFVEIIAPDQGKSSDA